MLDEAEFAIVFALYRDALRLHKQVEGQQEHPRRGGTLQDLYKPCLDEYQRLTGFRESNPNAVMHHRLSLFGPPCHSCGKPLRTPQASKCMACGAKRERDITGDAEN
jgi:hypothetical protein